MEYSTAHSPAKSRDWVLVALMFQKKLLSYYVFLSYIWPSCFQTQFLIAKVNFLMCLVDIKIRSTSTSSLTKEPQKEREILFFAAETPDSQALTRGISSVQG